MSSDGGRRLVRVGVPVVAIATAIALVSWFIAPASGRLPCKLTWEQALSGSNLLFSWLAERAQDRQGVPDRRLLSEPGRHLWATLHFEMAGFSAPAPDSAEPPPPTPAEIVDGYAAIGLPETAEAVQELATLHERGTARDAPEYRRALQRYGAQRGRCESARRAYLQAHRAKLERDAD